MPAQPNSQAKIQINHLTKIFGPRSKLRPALRAFQDGANRDLIQEQLGCVLAVADVSLQVDRGELFVIMGLSGSGKSTLLRCLNRLITPTSGQVILDGEDVLQASVPQLRQIRRQKLAMVFQKFALLPHCTVVENVEYGLKIQGIRSTQRREKALETLENVGLGQWANYLPSALSGGMQQRVGLARALATDADVLLMDEAFSALDPLIRREMQGELLRLQASLHKTIIFISHDIQEALRLGDRVAIMKDGAVEQVGTPEEIVLNPVNDYIEAFIQDVNRAQVLRTGSIARPQTPIVLGQHCLGEVLQCLQGDAVARGSLRRNAPDTVSPNANAPDTVSPNASSTNASSANASSANAPNTSSPNANSSNPNSSNPNSSNANSSNPNSPTPNPAPAKLSQFPPFPGSSLPSQGLPAGGYVVDEAGDLVGYVTRSSLESIAQTTALDSLNWNSAIVTKFPQVPAHLSLEESFPLCGFGLPLAVVDRSGRLQGVLDPTAIFAHIGKGRIGQGHP
ncbi:MAG: quaternary amine ABC transporter ATP-binding protein [Prochlorothrix sp.]